MPTLEAGKFYVTGHGDIVKISDERTPGCWLDEHGGIYHPDGTQWNHAPQSAGNIVARLSDESAARLLMGVQQTDGSAVSQAVATPGRLLVIVSDSLHPDTKNLVRDFAEQMAAKLRTAELKYGYRDGWLTQDWEAECRQHMNDHIAKGDPRDVAIYCAFMWARGWGTTLPAQSGSVQCREDVARALYKLNPSYSDTQFSGPKVTDWCYDSRQKQLAFKQADAVLALKPAGQPVEGLRAALESARAFIGVMFGRGPDAAIPETVQAPIGVPVKVGQIMRDIERALSPAPASPHEVPERETP